MKKSDSPVPTNCGEYVALNLYSSYDIRKAITEYFEEALPKAGYSTSMYLANIKLFLMFTGCLCGLYAHYGCKFPRDSLWVAFFAIAYFIQTGIIYLIDFFTVKKSCAVFDDKATNKRVYLDIVEPSVDSNLKIALRSEGLVVSSSKSVGTYFYSDGVLNQKAIFSEFTSLHEQFKSQAKSHKKID